MAATGFLYGAKDRLLAVRLYRVWAAESTLCLDNGASDTVDCGRVFAASGHQFICVYVPPADGDGTGLAEYSLGVEDEQAVDDFKRLFEYQWERAEPTG